MRPTSLMVHYTATYPDQDVTYAMVDAWHKAAGSKGFGYHGLIKRDGVLIEGRPLHVRGAHCRGGWNEHSLGLCYEGGLDRATGPNTGRDTRTPEQLKTMISVIKDWRAKINTIKDVIGHMDAVATQCPGFDAIGWWKSVEKHEPWSPSLKPPNPVLRTVTGPLLIKGHRGEAVRQLQLLLHKKGFPPGRIDGLFGKKTEDATRDFQAAAGIDIDGKVGPMTMTALLS